MPNRGLSLSFRSFFIGFMPSTGSGFLIYMTVIHGWIGMNHGLKMRPLSGVWLNPGALRRTLKVPSQCSNLSFRSFSLVSYAIFMGFWSSTGSSVLVYMTMIHGWIGINYSLKMGPLSGALLNTGALGRT